MKPMFRTLLIAGSLLTCATVQGAPYNRVLPAAVNNKGGNIFWCDAHRQVTGKCEAMFADRSGGMVTVRSAPLKDCEGRLWGWISIRRDEASKGFTITPDQKFGVTVKDLCRPGTIATFMPNHKKPDYDDLVVLYLGKELFRYKRF